MSEPISAPSPSPVVAAVAPPAAGKAPSAESAAANSADGQAQTPFATALQQQMAQPVDDKTARAIAALLNVEGTAADPASATATGDAADAAATGETAEDAIAFLAPMLAGIVPPAPESGKKLAVAATEEDKGDAAPTLIAAAVSSGAGTQTALPTTTQTDTRQTPVTTATDTAGRASANLAAETAIAAESAERAGKSAQTSFDSMLSAAREASLTAANNAAASHTPHVAASRNEPTATAIPVATPVGARGWDSEVGEKISWMANRQESRAELVLNPPHLGRIEVTLSMNGDQANATFVSANPAVREALENAVPRLREILQEAGVSLGQTQVGAESFQQSADKRENGDNPTRGGSRDSGTIANGFATGNSAPPQWARRGNGLVDTFA